MAENIRGGMRRLWSRDLQNLVSAVGSGEFEYEEKEKRTIDWNRYDEAQVNEIADMLQMINESVNIASERVRSREPKKKRMPGRPPMQIDDVVKIMMLQCYFGFSNRVAAGFLKMVTMIKFSDSFSYKTIERGYDPERTKPILDEVFKLTNEWDNFSETTFGIDGTGDPTTMKVNYESKRAEQRKEMEKKAKLGSRHDVNASWPSKKHDFQYDVISGGMHTKVIAGFSTTDDHHIGEFTQFPSVIKQTFDNAPNLSIVVGDRLYANRPACREVSFYGAALYSLPKSNATLRSRGVSDWKRMAYEFILDPQGFLNIYHNRSISETINSMMKRREPVPIRKRLSWRKGTEETLKVNIHNLRQSCYLRYLAPSMTKVPLYAG
jgi:transposase